MSVKAEISEIESRKKIKENKSWAWWVAQAFSAGTQEEAGGSMRIQSQPGLQI